MSFVIVILISLCGSRFVFQKTCARRETSWLNMGTADDYIYNLLVDAYNILYPMSWVAGASWRL